MQFAYNTYEKLKSRKLIKHLFEDGKAVTIFPLRLIYLKKDFDTKNPIKTSVSVSKRNFKLAVDRNRIKRLMREAYRLNKPFLYENVSNKYIFMFIYLGKEEIPLKKLNGKMKELISLFIKKSI
ncbi:MAG: ribonuclease P protein component [Flavobacteriaceae bacterium]